MPLLEKSFLKTMKRLNGNKLEVFSEYSIKMFNKTNTPRASPTKGEESGRGRNQSHL